VRVTVLFSTSNAWISRVIRWASRLLGRDKGRSSHALVCLEMLSLSLIVEATFPGGCRVLTRKRRFKGSAPLAEYKLLLPVQGDVNEALSLVGDDYDIPGLLGYIPVMIARWFKRKIKNPWASASKLVCSEFVQRFIQALVKVNIPEWKGLDPSTVLPDDLWERLEKGGSSFEKV